MYIELAEPILAGRDNEINQLNRFFEAANSGHGTTIFIVGQAGSGKTRLVTEFTNDLEDEETVILAGWCLSNSPIPYFPFIEALNSKVTFDLASGDQSDINLLIQPSFASLASKTLTDPEVWRDRVFAAVTKKLLYMASNKTIVLILEDIHWADSASLALLNYISRIVSNERILIIATFRIEELLQHSENQSNLLAQTIHVMGRDGLFYRIDLHNLNNQNVGKIAESMLGGQVDSNFIMKLATESEGNPLFVVESIRMIAEQNLFNDDNGNWQISGNSIKIPSKVREIILGRLGSLNTNQRIILDVAAVIGDKFEPEIIGAVLGKDELSILQILEELKSSLLLVLKDNLFVFNHEKIRELIYNELSEPLKKKYHERIAEKLVEIGTFASCYGKIAYHYDKAGNRKQAIFYSLVAGKDALKRYSNSEAVALFKCVLENDGPEISAVERELALEGLGDAYYANCRFEDAITTYHRLSMSNNIDVQLRAYRKEMESIWYKEEDSERLLSLVQKAEKNASLDSLEKARILWNKARAIMWLGQMKDALEAHKEALQVFENEFSLLDIAQLSFGLGVNMMMIGKKTDSGIAEILRAIAIFRDIGYVHGEILARYIGGVDCFFLCGLFDECYANAKRVIAIGESIGDYDDLAQAWLRLSDAPENSGDILTAISFCKKALDYSSKTDTKGTECRIYAKLAGIYAINKNLESADEYYTKLIAMPSEILWHPRNFLPIAYYISFFFGAKGDLEKAKEYHNRCNEFILRNYPNSAGLKNTIQKQKSWILEKQGNVDGAKKEKEEASLSLRKIRDAYNCFKPRAFLSVKDKILENQYFEIRIDFVNTGAKRGSIISMEGVLTPEFEVLELPSGISKKYYNFGEIQVDPFSTLTLKIKAKAKQSGLITFEPKFDSKDESGHMKQIVLETIKVVVLPHELEMSDKEEIPKELIFKSVNSQKAYEFLVDAFNEDYIKRRFPKERSGWKTLNNIAKGASISPYSVYGSSRNVRNIGPVISELQRMGLTETRFFVAERGRGGRVLKVRISQRVFEMQSEKEETKKRE
jgi:predicted ATPase